MTTTTIDLVPAARSLASLVAAVPDDALDRPTPCPDYALGDLLEHVGALGPAFGAAARKDLDATADPPPAGDRSRLGPDWRERIPRDLDAVARAWADPAAWTGMTRAGGIDLPGEACGLVLLDELVVHGWDVARSIGRPFACEPALLEAVHGFVAQFSGPGKEAEREGLFGPEVPVPADAPLLDRVLGMTGRDPQWGP